MCRKLFFALGLHLLTEKQLYLVIFTVCEIEFIILLIFMRWVGLFVELVDFPIGSAFIYVISHTLFMVDHVEFFHSIMYVNVFLALVCFYTWLYTEFIMDPGEREAMLIMDKEEREENKKKKEENKKKKEENKKKKW